MNDQQIESEIQAKGLTAPRVTPSDIEAAIASEHYFTAYEGAQASQIFTFHAPVGGKSGMFRPLELLTFCVLVLRNGFTVTGESACASPENFDAEIGKKIARQNAVNKVWMLEGYLLRQRLCEAERAIGATTPGSNVQDQDLRIDATLEEASRAFVGGSFGKALEHIQRGGRVAREGWNGKGMWLTLIRAGNAMHMGFDMQDCVGMKTANGVMQPGWLASQNDMLASDWCSVEG